MRDFHALAKAMTAEAGRTLRLVDAAEINRLRHAIVASKQVFVAGYGRSGLHMRAFAMRLMHLGLTVSVVGEATSPAASAGDLLIIGSKSGRSPALAHIAAQVSTVGGAVALITANPQTPLDEHASHRVMIPISTLQDPETSQAGLLFPLGSHFEVTLGLLLDALVLQLMNQLGVSEPEMAARHTNLE